MKYNFQSTSGDDQKLQPAKYNSLTTSTGRDLSFYILDFLVLTVFEISWRHFFCRGRCNRRLEMNSEKRKKICRENIIILSFLNSFRKIFSSISLRNPADKKEEQKINYNNTIVATMYSNKTPFLVYYSVKNALILLKENR